MDKMKLKQVSFNYGIKILNRKINITNLITLAKYNLMLEQEKERIYQIIKIKIEGKLYQAKEIYKSINDKVVVTKKEQDKKETVKKEAIDFLTTILTKEELRLFLSPERIRQEKIFSNKIKLRDSLIRLIEKKIEQVRNNKYINRRINPRDIIQLRKGKFTSNINTMIYYYLWELKRKSNRKNKENFNLEVAHKNHLKKIKLKDIKRIVQEQKETIEKKFLAQLI